MKKLSARRRRLSIKALCVLAVAFSGIFAVARLFVTGGRPSLNSLTELDTGWYRLEAGSAVPVSPGEKIPFGEDGTVTLYLPVSSDGTITTRSALYCVQISLDGTKVYCYDDSAFPCNDQMRSKIHCDATLRDVNSGSILSITYYSNGAPELEMPPVYFGTSGDVLLDHIAAEGFTLALIALMLLCAIASMGVSVYLAMNHMLDKRFLDVMVFLILCSVWCFCDSGLARYMSRMSAGVEGISFYAFMTLGIPFSRLVTNTGSIKKRISMHLVTAGFFVNVVVQTILWAVGAALTFVPLLPSAFWAALDGTFLSAVQFPWRLNGLSQLCLALCCLSATGLAAIKASTAVPTVKLTVPKGTTAHFYVPQKSAANALCDGRHPQVRQAPEGNRHYGRSVFDVQPGKHTIVYDL